MFVEVWAFFEEIVVDVILRDRDPIYFKSCMSDSQRPGLS